MATINEKDIFIAGSDESEAPMAEGIKKLFGGFCDPTSEKKELFCDPSAMFAFSDDDVKDRSLETEDDQADVSKKVFTKKRIGITSVLLIAVLAVIVGVSGFRNAPAEVIPEPVSSKRGLFKRK